MAFPEPGARGASPVPDDEHTFPHFPSAHSDAPGTAPSIISSRMTDIMSDDGTGAAGDLPPGSAGAGAGGSASSRPPTALTGRSSARNSLAQPAFQPLRRGLSGKRSSAGSSAGTATVAYGGRPVSSTTSRSHVPSLTSHAFFHPMSSQKLQAQRGGVARPRQSLLGQQQQQQQEQQEQPQQPQQPQQSQEPQLPLGAGDAMAGVAPPMPVAAPPFARPISRGSEYTDQMTVDRITANTSPTGGFYPAASLTDSVRPLYQQGHHGGAKAGGGAGASAGADAATADAAAAAPGRQGGLTIRVDKALKSGHVGSLPTPVRTPKSFRSSFMLPGKGGLAGDGQGANRDIQGGEKLESVASTPRRSRSAASHPSNGTHVNSVYSPLPDHQRKTQGGVGGGGGGGGSKSGGSGSASFSGKNYQFFQGNTVFCLGGRFENTKSRPVNIATGALVVIPSILFFVFSAPWLWHHVSPAIPVTFAYVFYICLSSFFHASLTDPGILPRNLHQFPAPDENDDPLRLGPSTTEWALIKSCESSTAAMEVPVKYCRTCNIWRPPRAHHCRMCDNCVETADHHCVWLNNCVGRRNYRYFFTFVTSCTALSLYLVAASLVQLLVYRHREAVSFGSAIGHFRVPFAMFLYGILACAYPVPLMFYHLFLMARGETTREFLNSHKFPKKDRYRAYTQGRVLLNWVAVLCRPRPPTYYRFKSRHMVGDQRLAAEPQTAAAQKSRGGRGGGGLDAGSSGAFTKGDALEMQDVPAAAANPAGGSGFQGPVALRNDA